MIDLTVVILTYNEELNILKCLSSVKSIAKRIIVIDSFSTDNTKKICSNFGVDFYENKFTNHADQFKKTLELGNVTTKWILKLDADECLTEESASEISSLCQIHSNDDINGLVLRFKLFFLGKYLKHGGTYPVRKLVVFKNKLAHIEQKEMDEHIVLDSGKVVYCKKDSLHYDCKSLFEWVDKHNKYSTKETKDYFQKNSINEIEKLDPKAKKSNKNKQLYYKISPRFRSKLYYLYRYYLKFGFLDGRQGKIYAFLQAYWYRFLVDAKIFEEQVKKNNKEVG